MKLPRSPLYNISILALINAIAVNPSFAQVTTDGTTSTTVTPTDTGVQIDSGNRSGDNLFHSFDDFSVPTNSEAFFNNANDVVNIFSRVTGGNISNIDGTLRANGAANLFLINPAGIVFGENARLQLGGSFYGSTADSIIFPNGKFSATDLENPPLITVNAPIGLGFRDNPNSITVRGNGNGVRLTDSELIDTNEALRVDSSATIGLIGGNLIFEDATIKTAGGRIELGSVAGGDVGLVEEDNGFTFDYSEINTFQDISLSGTNSIDASGLGGGAINVTGKNISLTDLSILVSHTLGSIPGNGIDVLASESLTISGVENEFNFNSGIVSRTFPSGTADAGDINIETGSLVMGDRSIVSTFVSGAANAGDININASESVSLVSQGNTSAIQSSLATGAIGNGGDITIATPSLSISNGAFISSNTSGQGNAGNIDFSVNTLTLVNGAFFDGRTLGQGNAGNVTINATDIVSLDGRDSFAAIATNVGSDAIGNGGDIIVTTNSLNIANNALFRSDSSGQGNAGNIELNANSITLKNSSELNTSITGQGKGGNVIINATDDVSFLNGSELNTSSTGQGKGGDVIINTTDDVSFINGSNIFVAGSGGGSINISAKNLSLISDSSFLAGINSNLGFADADSGDIVIKLTEDLVLDGLEGENINTITNSNSGTGNAGNIEIEARNITFRNGGNISSFNGGAGNIGNISLTATENILFDGIRVFFQSGIFNNVSKGATGNVGEINLTAQSFTVANGAAISSTVAGTANSGDLNLNITDIITVDGFGEVVFDETQAAFASVIQSVVADSGIGNAGKINIETQNLHLSKNGNINANILGQGNAGDININANLITISEQGNIDLTPSSISSGVVNEFLPETETSDSIEAQAGDIKIEANSLLITDGGFIEADVFLGTGNSGNISIAIADTLSLDGSGIIKSPNSGERTRTVSEISSRISFDSQGNSGNIEVSTPNLSITNGANINSDNGGLGNAGDINITANNINLDGETPLFVFEIDGQLIETTLSSSISSEVVNSSFFSRNDIVAEGNGGNITINTDSLSITNSGGIGTDNSGVGNGGDININANEIKIDGTGDEFIESTRTDGTVSRSQTRSEISSSINSSIIVFPDGTVAEGNGGNITINTDSLSITNGANIDTDNSGVGNSGNITINAPKDILVDGSSVSFLDEESIVNASEISSDVTINGIGNGGNIEINTPKLSLSNRAEISTSTFGEGNAGELNIQLTDSLNLSGSSVIQADVFPGATGNGGNLLLKTARLSLADGGQISVSTAGKGNAGILTVSASDSIELNGVSDRGRSGLFASALEQDGNSGELNIFTQDLIVSDGATITASNFPSIEGLREPGTGEAGSITIKANNITLANEGRINTATQAGDEGNITLNVNEDIILRDNSFISTQALKNATGGNIEIDAEFIIAFPSRFDGNDIRADANQGQGGNINITAESVFGIAESNRLNPLTNDINASSQVSGLDGTISINTPDINPLRATSELPSNLISTNTLAATSACNASSIEELSNLILKGKGGILPQVTESFTSDSLITEEPADNLSLLNSNLIQNTNRLLLNNLTQNSRETKIPFGIKPAIETEETGKLYAARGIVRQEDGEVYLTAYPTSDRKRDTVAQSHDCSFNTD